MDLFSAMDQRRSIRAFLDKPVSREDIEKILKYAGKSPSAINLQPWEYVITYGEEKDRLVRRLKRAHSERSVPCGPGTEKPLPENFSSRSRGALKIMQPQIAKTGKEFNQFIEQGSCSFYGAPIAIIVTIDRIFPKLRYLDIGLSVSYLLLAAQAIGLSTCPIGLITSYSDEITDMLDMPDGKEVLLGIAMGYADIDSPVNDFKIDREKPDSIMTWYE